MVIGLLGTGIIGSAVVRGFCKDGDTPHRFVVSPRNAEKAAALAADFPQLVQIASDNQQVLDEADIVFLALLRPAAPDILKPLHFRKGLRIINLIAGQDMKELNAMTGEAEVLADVVPLTFIVERYGPILVCPPHPEAIALLEPLGDVVSVKQEQEMLALRCITALMSPYYMELVKLVDWCGEQGVSEPLAKAFTTSFFGALCRFAAQSEEGKLEELALERTPGGLNDLALNHLFDRDAYTPWIEALDRVVRRTTGEE